MTLERVRWNNFIKLVSRMVYGAAHDAVLVVLSSPFTENGNNLGTSISFIREVV